MLDALKRELPGWVRWTEPQGGMFVWVQLPAGPAENDATPLLQRALAERVAFVPGESFFAEKPQKHTFRLSFATTPPEKICEGARRLGSLIERHCRATPHPSR
jgi:2-aminoadipate transaminase